VKAAKRMIRKAKKAGEDEYMALLNIRNTPRQDTGSSPTQMFLGRCTKTTLPTTESLLQPNAVNKGEMEQLKRAQKRQAKYYNRSSHDLPILAEGDNVRMKPFRLGEKAWKHATVVERLDQRSYEVEADNGTLYRRNRVHLKKTNEPPCKPSSEQVHVIPAHGNKGGTPLNQSTPPSSIVVEESHQDEPPPLEKSSATPTTPRGSMVARPHRPKKMPVKYQDFVMGK
jgi:hypothetical protein